jgi:hypothetical protein
VSAEGDYERLVSFMTENSSEMFDIYLSDAKLEGLTPFTGKSHCIYVTLVSAGEPRR